MPFMITDDYEDDHVALNEGDFVFEYVGDGVAKKDFHLLIKLNKEDDNYYEIPMSVVIPMSEKKINERKGE